MSKNSHSGYYVANSARPGDRGPVYHKREDCPTIRQSSVRGPLPEDHPRLDGLKLCGRCSGQVEQTYAGESDALKALKRAAKEGPA